MSRPQTVLIWSIQRRTTRVNKMVRYRVRWEVDGKESSRIFPTKAQANEFHSRLVVARSNGQRPVRNQANPNRGVVRTPLSAKLPPSGLPRSGVRGLRSRVALRSRLPLKQRLWLSALVQRKCRVPRTTT